ncbi:transposase [Bradyrhizobium sp. 143]|uniref:transposase n=1 Tax=Bradyrhizobium sp. 143 TaxID=2782619 RepID=UPI002097490F|nr:transposase [Bradyrhizobium sp. 143]MCK1709266.1 transposase [Bradyrhizobium sp. 143]
MSGRIESRHVNATEEPLIANDMMNLGTLAEKPDADLVREMIGFAAKRLTEHEVESQTGADYGDKNPRASGAAERPPPPDREIRAGTVELRIPKLRKSSYFPVCGSRAGWSKALSAGVQDTYQGVSTRSVGELVQEGDERHFQKPGAS